MQPIQIKNVLPAKNSVHPICRILKKLRRKVAGTFRKVIQAWKDAERRQAELRHSEWQSKRAQIIRSRGTHFNERFWM